MSNALRDRLRLSRTDDDQQTTRLRALAGALGLTVGGTVFSFLVFLIYRPTVMGVLEPVSPALATLAVSKATQIGFLLGGLRVSHRPMGPPPVQSSERP